MALYEKTVVTTVDEDDPDAEIECSVTIRRHKMADGPLVTHVGVHDPQLGPVPPLTTGPLVAQATALFAAARRAAILGKGFAVKP